MIRGGTASCAPSSPDLFFPSLTLLENAKRRRVHSFCCCVSNSTPLFTVSPLSSSEELKVKLKQWPSGPCCVTRKEEREVHFLEMTWLVYSVIFLRLFASQLARVGQVQLSLRINNMKVM